jgi:hypothetical protein
MKNNKGDGLSVGRYQAQTAPTIEWCRIEDNGDDGIYFTMSDGYIKNTRIKDNNNYGIYCWHNSSEPVICKSKITGNSTGVRTFYSEPIIGDSTRTDSSGYNTIDNNYYNVYNGHAMIPPPEIKAENCFWGQSPPPTSKFGGGDIDYEPYLTSDPVTYLAMFAREDRRTPTTVYLHQSFPNPLTTGRITRIKYSIPKTDKVTIRVYDVSGRRVKTLIDKVQRPGHHYVSWNGRNEKSNRVSPGIYFYQMKVGTKVISKKIVILQ